MNMTILLSVIGVVLLALLLFLIFFVKDKLLCSAAAAKYSKEKITIIPPPPRGISMVGVPGVPGGPIGVQKMSVDGYQQQRLSHEISGLAYIDERPAAVAIGPILEGPPPAVAYSSGTSSSGKSSITRPPLHYQHKRSFPQQTKSTISRSSLPV